jgi:predicted  nucleic acid-binding Zn-ribbon protein
MFSADLAFRPKMAAPETINGSGQAEGDDLPKRTRGKRGGIGKSGKCVHCGKLYHKWIHCYKRCNHCGTFNHSASWNGTKLASRCPNIEEKYYNKVCWDRRRNTLAEAATSMEGAASLDPNGVQGEARYAIEQMGDSLVQDAAGYAMEGIKAGDEDGKVKAEEDEESKNARVWLW